MSFKAKPVIITIEGDAGSGKTHLARLIKQLCEEILREPVVIAATGATINSAALKGRAPVLIIDKNG